MAAPWGTPASQPLASQLMDVCHKRASDDPLSVLPDDLRSRPIYPSHKGVAPLGGSTDVDVTAIIDVDHRHQNIRLITMMATNMMTMNSVPPYSPSPK